MPRLVYRTLLGSMLASLVVGCLDSTSPEHTGGDGLIPGPPDLTVTVVQSTYLHFFAPNGSWVSGYALWIATPGSATPDAGVELGSKTLVFVGSPGALRPATPASISVGDTIQVWQGAVAYGDAEAPPGTPSYSAKQVIIVR